MWRSTITDIEPLSMTVGWRWTLRKSGAPQLWEKLEAFQARSQALLPARLQGREGEG